MAPSPSVTPQEVVHAQVAPVPVPDSSPGSTVPSCQRHLAETQRVAFVLIHVIQEQTSEFPHLPFLSTALLTFCKLSWPSSFPIL